MTHEEMKQHYAGLFEQFESSLNGEKALPVHQKRKAAIEYFSTAHIPNTKDEEWKYTNIGPIIAQSFARPAQTADMPAKEVLAAAGVESDLFYTLVFHNGTLVKQSGGELPAGVTIEPMHDAVKKEYPELSEKLGSLIPHDKDFFSSLNAAFLQQGALILLKKNSVLEKPVQIINVITADSLMVAPRSLLVAEPGAEAMVFETFYGAGEHQYFTNSVFEFFVAPNATVKYVRVQDESKKAYHVSNIAVSQSPDSKFFSYNMNFGGSIVRNNISAEFTGQNAETHMYGASVVDGNRLIDNHTAIDHAVPHCESHQLYKAVLSDDARGVFNGKVMVRKDAQKTNAFQQNNTLLLSANALIDSKPQLEIFADDVKCSHGATIGRLDETSMFYLKSRGIGEEAARKMLVHAFASETISNLEQEEIAGYIEQLFTSTLD